MMFAQLVPLAFDAILGLSNPISYEYSGQTDASGTAFIEVIANEELDDVEVEVEGDDQTIKKAVGDMNPGQHAKITWSQKSPRARYEADIRSRSIEATFAFEVVRMAGSEVGTLGRLKVRSTRDDIIERGQATFETTFALNGYEFKVYDGGGDTVAAGTVTKPIAAGERFTISWTQGVNVFMIFVRGEDEFGRFVEQKLVPWSVEIPHTEITFDSGKSNIKDDESAKLDEAVAVAFHELVALEKVNEAVQANITPQLYIVGYTDTVGSSGANLRLSRSRAQSIASYFADQGFWAAIYYAGMGERGLRVETDDSVDEARNRRALYVIGVQQPTAGGQIPAQWTRLIGPRPKPPGFELPPLPEAWADYRNQAQLEARGKTEASLAETLPSADASQTPPREPAREDLQMDYDASEPKPATAAEGPPPVESGRGCAMGRRSGFVPAGLIFLFGIGSLRRRSRRHGSPSTSARPNRTPTDS